MATAIHVPRVNNNDDEVKLVGLSVAAGERVSAGQVIAQVETDKAVVDVECHAEGFVLAVQGELEAQLRVGAVLAWIGASADEAVPTTGAAAASGPVARLEPTAKAKALLAQHGLRADQVPASGDRLSVADIERYLAAPREAAAAPAATPLRAAEPRPAAPGALEDLKSEERGMLATVTWHRDVAVPGYIEMPYDPAPWEAHAKTVGEREKLLLSPLLPLMAWRLVQVAAEHPRLNSTIVDGKRYRYAGVNLGFTVQAGDVLYLAVVRDAAALGEIGFVQALVDLQRRAAGHKLGPQELQGATLGFSSMARWKVSRHIPVLAPHTALMVAHAAGPDGQGVLGATYDHRVLSGSDVAVILRQLARPAAQERTQPIA